MDKFSIWANQLVEKVVNGAKAVLHGMIREVSLVISGANPGALIDFVAIQHGDDPEDRTVLTDEAFIHTGIKLALGHSEIPEGLSDEELLAFGRSETTPQDSSVQHAQGNPTLQ